jgi:hypothetical protein
MSVYEFINYTRLESIVMENMKYRYEEPRHIIPHSTGFQASEFKNMPWATSPFKGVGGPRGRARLQPFKNAFPIEKRVLYK